MKSFQYRIKDPLGIHARLAGILSMEVKKYESSVQVRKGDTSVMATELLKLMGLGVKQGDEVEIIVEGTDEEVAVKKIQEFFEKVF